MNQERFALIAGATSGLGLEVAFYLIDIGYTVIGLGPTAAAEELGDNPQYIGLELDPRAESSFDALADFLEREVFGLDLVFNGLHFFQKNTCDDLTPDHFEDHFKIHVSASFHLIRVVRHHLIPERTHIIHFSTPAIFEDLSRFGAYNASKLAMEKIIDAFKLEWQEQKLNIFFTTLSLFKTDTSEWKNSDLDANFDTLSPVSLENFLRTIDFVIHSPFVSRLEIATYGGV